MEHQMEKNMEKHMETVVMKGIIGFILKSQGIR